MKKSFNTPKTYGHPHKLKSNSGKNGFTCDNCHNHGENFYPRYTCFEDDNKCDFDLCFDCYYRAD